MRSILILITILFAFPVSASFKAFLIRKSDRHILFAKKDLANQAAVNSWVATNKPVAAVRYDIDVSEIEAKQIDESLLFKKIRVEIKKRSDSSVLFTSDNFTDQIHVDEWLTLNKERIAQAAGLSVAEVSDVQTDLTSVRDAEVVKLGNVKNALEALDTASISSVSELKAALKLIIEHLGLQ